jgi:hypothetical protein
MSQAEISDTTSPSRRALLAGAPAAAAAALAGGTIANTVAIGMAKTAEVDPIFVAIEHERAAYADYLATAAAADIDDPIPPPLRDDPDFEEANKRRVARPEHKAWWARWKEADAAHTEAAQRLWTAREAFLQTRPTSVAGLIAFIDHIEGPFSSGDAGEAFWDENEKELAVPTLAAAVRDLISGRQA